MLLTFKIDDFLTTIFPGIDIGLSEESLIQEILKFYTVGPFEPKVTIKGDQVVVEIDTPKMISQKADYDKVVGLCNKQRYDLAKPILQKLIRNNPSVSEYHRILGQIYYDEMSVALSEDSLIEALRWNPRNQNALLMLGNLFAKHKSDFNTALKFYDEVLGIDPKDYITLCNIGANLLGKDSRRPAVPGNFLRD
jgi:tetratricopeptide (TPR) repeat protein